MKFFNKDVLLTLRRRPMCIGEGARIDAGSGVRVEQRVGTHVEYEYRCIRSVYRLTENACL